MAKRFSRTSDGLHDAPDFGDGALFSLARTPRRPFFGARCQLHPSTGRTGQSRAKRAWAEPLPGEPLSRPSLFALTRGSKWNLSRDVLPRSMHNADRTSATSCCARAHGRISGALVRLLYRGITACQDQARPKPTATRCARAGRYCLPYDNLLYDLPCARRCAKTRWGYSL